MTDYIIKFHFSSPLRIGAEDIGLEGISPELHSDTLFSAVCHALVDIYGGDWLIEKLKDFVETNPFILSSCFPFAGEDYYLPRPFGRTVIRSNPAAAESIKSIKQLRYLTPPRLADWLANRECLLEELVSDNRKAESTSQEYLTPRVALDRLDNSATLYLCSQKVFKQGAGLYVLLRLHDSSWEPLLHNAFAFLGEQGLGSERNNGFGRFEISWEKPSAAWNGLLQSQGNRFYIVGLFHPKSLAQSWQESSYALVERRGWFWSAPTGTQMKRKTVWMFREGSLFPFRPDGHLLNLQPDTWDSPAGHPVYRSGVPFAFSF